MVVLFNVDVDAVGIKCNVVVLYSVVLVSILDIVCHEA